MRVDEFIYELPDAAIAQEAVEPRDASRLLDTRDMSDHTFRDLPQLLARGDLLVVNNTRVRRARLLGAKEESGGAIELLILDSADNGVWEAMIRPARRVRPGTRLSFGTLVATVVRGPVDGLVAVQFEGGDPEMVMETTGLVPLPPYFRGELEDSERYQTIYSRSPGSAAAPTAGLHFTPRVLERLAESGVDLAEIDLHVGIDTFRPMTTELIEDHRMHSERCSVPEETAAQIVETRSRGGRVVAVGTTTTRALETFGKDDGTVTSGEAETDLFLRPGSSFRVVDVMITNFHAPGSTLVAMVSGFMGPRWRDAYRHALSSGYRFLSFGDAMLAARWQTGQE